MILDAGVDVQMVQVGNETNNGMAGEKSRGMAGAGIRCGEMSELNIEDADVAKKEILLA